MRKLLFVLCSIFLCHTVAAQEMTVSSLHDKDSDGRSLMMQWNESSARFIYPDSRGLAESFAGGAKRGVTFWIYCEEPVQGSLKCAIEGLYGEICHFNVNLGFTGWRAVWIKYIDMHSPSGEWYQWNAKDKPVRLAVMPSAPAGKCWIDRLSFSSADLHNQIAPDAQIPDNNHHIGSRRSMWQWACLWLWEQNPAPEPVEVSSEDARSLERLRENLSAYFAKSIAPAANVDGLRKNCQKQYQELIDKPIVYNNELTASDAPISKVIDLGWRYANLYHHTGEKEALDRYFEVMDRLIDQGFAWGSSMGTNTHYGYQIRNLAPSLFLMQDQIRQSGRAEKYFGMLEYWSGEAECRVPYDPCRDEIVDAWNTLNLPRLASALLQSTLQLQLAHVRAVTSWIEGSMRYTPGTIGGMKPDGTAFHHGGHYPSYWEGGLNSLGIYFTLVAGTGFVPDVQARSAVKNAALALSTYTINAHWGVGIGGRHPERTKAADGAVHAIKALSQLGDLSGSGKATDPQLDDAYRRMTGGKDDLSGFYSYNYGAFGIWRTRGWMMTLKSMNIYTWGSEIYATENRFGRYNSYGSLQIMPTGATSIHEEGWDWNSLPGVTAVHLPYDKLNSPRPGTLMQRGSERFGGVGNFGTKAGAMAFVNTEPDLPGFAAGFRQVKSTFCFPDYVLSLGSGITNSSSYPTMTTLFQDWASDQQDMDTRVETLKDGRRVVLDIYENYYYVASAGELKVGVRTNTSPDNRNKKTSSGRFLMGWIDHGSSPANASVEYMIALSPTSKELAAYKKAKPYIVRECSDSRHCVYDTRSGIEATVDFAGQVIWFRQNTDENHVLLSVGTPDLGIEKIEYTTLDSGKALQRSVTLEGVWTLDGEYPSVTLETKDNTTVVTVMCSEGVSTLIKLSK